MSSITSSTVRARAAVSSAVKKADQPYNNRQVNGPTAPVLFMDEADDVVSALRQMMKSDPRLDPARVGRALRLLSKTEFVSTFNASREAFNPFLRELEHSAGLAKRSLGTVPSRDVHT
jgi:hypothetical protein